jgi:hypothetical protein
MWFKMQEYQPHLTSYRLFTTSDVMCGHCSGTAGKLCSAVYCTPSALILTQDALKKGARTSILYSLQYKNNCQWKNIVSHTTDVCVGADTQQLLKVRAGTIQGPRVHNPSILIFHFDAGTLPEIYVTTRRELQYNNSCIIYMGYVVHHFERRGNECCDQIETLRLQYPMPTVI